MSSAIGRETARKIVELRNLWHTKDHPFYVEFSEGKFDLEPLGLLQAQHYQHTKRTWPALGITLSKAAAIPAGRHALIENLAEEEGIAAGPGEDRHPYNHFELILRFCRISGLTDAQVEATEQLASWRARSYYYLNVAREEPFPVIVAMMSTQEGQQPGINAERTLPALYGRHGFKKGDPAIEFFAEHEIADADHSNRQIRLVETLVNTDELAQRALEVAETALKTRWACMNEIYRVAVKGERDPLPRGLAA
jgi:pyrroloquinoline quinone (PQQ) biosynthesis protein C